MVLSRLFDGLANALFPQDCHVCGGKVESLNFGIACRRCWERTRMFTGKEALCPKCGRLLRFGGGPAAGNCHRCEDHAYDFAVSCGIYEKAMAMTVLSLKSEPHVPPILKAALTDRALWAGLDAADLIIPVPLSRKRRKERGFNQAETVAAALKTIFGIHIEAGVLKRSVDTPIHRAAMDERARAATVKGAFEVIDAMRIRERHVVIVDDVMTSGATVSYCADELKRNGARRVSVMTLARA